MEPGGPLKTRHVQYGAAYVVRMSPAPILSNGIAVGLCAGEGKPFHGPEDVHYRLRLAFSVLGDDGSEKALVIPTAASAALVSCAPTAEARSILGRVLSALGPRPAYAWDTGLGGLYPGGCSHPGCRVAQQPFPGMTFGVIDPAAEVR